MVTAEAIYKQANIGPTDFGVEVVPSDVTDETQQRTLAIAHIQDLILPGAISEVWVPMLKVSQGITLPFSDAVILRKYPNMTDPTVRSFVNSNLQTLFENAVKSYARSEINKQVATNDKGYDVDSDQDRKNADATLKKLTDTILDLLTGPPETTTTPLPSPENGLVRNYVSVAVRLQPTF